MRRREVVAGLCAASAPWAVAVRAQTAGVRVGLLGSTSEAEWGAFVVGLRQGLRQAGFIEGSTVAIEYRWAESQFDRLPALAADLVARNVAAIVTVGGSISARAAKAATTTIPVIFVLGADPVRLGFVDSLSRPGGNVTGVSFLLNALVGKRLALLRELLPGSTKVGLLVNPKNPNAVADTASVRDAAQLLKFEVFVSEASSEAAFAPAFASFAASGCEALLLLPDPLFISRRSRIVELAAVTRLPTIYEQATVGGLISYGTNLVHAHRQAGAHLGRILKGERPADLPVFQSTTYELIVNLKTAKALGIDIPSSLLARADEVIE